MRDGISHRWVRGLALLATLFFGGCGGPTWPIDIQYEFTDAPERQRVELSYHNDLRRAVCLSPEDWPNEGGAIDQASDRVQLVVDGRRFPIIDMHTGYCPGCETKVLAGDSLSGFIRYADFNLPLELYERPKQLVLKPDGNQCMNWDWTRRDR